MKGEYDEQHYENSSATFQINICKTLTQNDIFTWKSCARNKLKHES